MLFYQGFRRAQRFSLGCGLLVLFIATHAAWAGFHFDHSSWGRLLKAHLSEEWVNYRGFSGDREELDHYLERLSAVRKTVLESWPREEQIAFYLNAYNAITVERILDHYPTKGVQTIPGVWNEIQDRVAGQDLTLDDIEHEILSKRYREPLVHFAVSRASRSGPLLPEEPFEGENLVEQLHQRTQEFLLDTSRGVSIDYEKNRVYLPELFDWFGEDFIPRYGTGALSERYGEKLGACLNFVSGYLPRDQKEFIRGGGYQVEFLPYDWLLNERTSK